MRLEGRVALVAGGAGSMGSAVAQLFAAEGAAVCVADMDKERADEVVGEIVEDGGRSPPRWTSVKPSSGNRWWCRQKRPLVISI